MITFVTFYMDVTSQTMDAIHQTTSTITVSEPHQYIRTMFGSARHFHPDCGQVILGDRHTRFPPHPDTAIVRYDLDAKNPMMSRSSAWLQYMRGAADHTIFLDSDILINGDLSHIFERDFAIALTYRVDKKWPINAGINFAHGQRLGEAARFYERWLQLFERGHHGRSVWGGDQDVLRELFGDLDFAREDCFAHDQDGIKILFIPCSVYNFSTSYEHEMDGHYPDKKVLHFKGRRKPHLFPYWRRHFKRATSAKG